MYDVDVSILLPSDRRSGAVNNFLEVTCQEDAFDIEDLVTQRMCCP